MSDNIKIIADKVEIDDIAESVREKTKLTGKMHLQQIAHNIRHMAGIGEGILTSDATITSGDQMLEGVTAYGASGIVTGTIPSQEAANIVPNDNEQIAIPAGTYAEGDVIVSPVPTEEKTISSNGMYLPEEGKYFSSINVNVKTAGGNFETQSKTVVPTETRQTVVPDAEYDGLSNVIVEAIPADYVGSIVVRESAKTIVPNNESQVAISKNTYVTGEITVAPVPTETKEISSNGTHTPADGKYFSSVSVNVPEKVFETQSKTVTPTKSQQTLSPDEGFDGLSGVIVEAIPNEYITTTDATVTSEKMFLDETAYVNGEKVTGSFTIDAEVTEQEGLIDQIQAALEGKASNNLDTSDATATAEDIVKDKTAYVNGVKLIGTHECSSDEKTTKTVYLDWTEDYENTGKVEYLSNDQWKIAYKGDDVIEVENGIMDFEDSYQYDSDSFVYVWTYNMDFYIVKKDGATLKIITSGEQGV